MFAQISPGKISKTAFTHIAKFSISANITVYRTKYLKIPSTCYRPSIPMSGMAITFPIRKLFFLTLAIRRAGIRLG